MVRSDFSLGLSPRAARDFNKSVNMMRRKNWDRRRLLRCESLESRKLLAAYINEIHYSPLFGDNTTDQYVELRGPANAQLEQGTYFIGIESADGVNELGDIHTIFDLSEKSFGSNGLMALIQGNAGFDLNADASIYQGQDGFQGLPGFSADGDATSIHDGSSTYLLIQSDIPPTLTDDIDSNDNGVADGSYLNWTILDGVSVFDWVEGVWDQHAYAPILFTDDNVGSSLDSTTRVVTEDLAYVARLGNSTGYAAEDWVAANTVETDRNDRSWDFELQRGIFGTPRPKAYSARILDHIGGPNWFSSFSGSVFQDRNADGMRQADEPGIGGLQVGASRAAAGQGLRTYVEEVNADNYQDGDDVSIESSNVTLSSAGSDNVHHSFEITVRDKVFTEPEKGQQFAHAGVSFFNENRRLRMDFFEPVHRVSANFRGNSSLSDVYGRLEIFNEQDESLGFLRTQPLRDTDEQMLTLARPTNDIAYAVAYSNDDYLDSSPFGRIDYLSFEMSEPQTVTDENGNYSLSRITDDDYRLFVEPAPGYDVSAPDAGFYQLDVDKPTKLSNLDFALVGGIAPTFTNKSFVASEAAAPGSVVGDLAIQLGYPHQQLTAEILSGDASEQFSVDLVNNRLVLASDIDFEAQPQYELLVRVTDVFDSDLFAEATVNVTVADANDAPVIAPFGATIAENSEVGTVLGTIKASDQDTTFSNVFVLSIEEGNTGAAFALDEETGELTVATPEPLDFETNQSFLLTVRATDKSDAAVFSERKVTVAVTDVNDAPVVPPQTLMASEAALPSFSIGFLDYREPDALQSLNWAITQQPDGDLFTIHSGGELRLSDAARLNYEATDQYELVVKATDNGTPALSTEQTVTIQVTDANDPPQLTTDSIEFSEAAAPGSVIGTISASDEDAGQTLSYAMFAGDEELFSVEGDTGAITLADGAQIDFETTSSYEIVVDITDSGSLPQTTRATLALLVTDANDAPVLVGSELGTSENALPGSSVGSISVEDQDANDSHTFSLDSQAIEWFTIDPDTGELSVVDGATVDYETATEVAVTVSVADAAGATDSKELTVTIENRNDAPKLVDELPDVETQINEEFSLQIPEETFSDDDPDDSLRWVAVTDDGFPLPTWLNFDQDTRTLSGTPAATDVGQLAVKIQVIDQSQAFAADTFIIDVKPEPYPWHNGSLAEDTNGDTVVAPSDALRVINYLNGGRPAAIEPGADAQFGMIDVNRDNFVSAIDVLIIVNYLNREKAGGGGEGEASRNQAVEAYFAEYETRDPWKRWRDERIALKAGGERDDL
ncbi:MAG: hypothetical protein Aurels2KO_09760 [Aureliella sp.]